jgi:hypothetical protein
MLRSGVYIAQVSRDVSQETNVSKIDHHLSYEFSLINRFLPDTKRKQIKT